MTQIHSSTFETAPQIRNDEGPDDQVNLLEYWDIVLDSRWLILFVTLAALALGGGYAILSRPVYESNLLIQVEDSAASAKNLLGDAASLFEVKTAASAEVEILKSRMVVGAATDMTLFYIEARPRYLPIIGEFLARKSKTLSTPLPGGFVAGTERIAIAAFEVPHALEGEVFTLRAISKNQYELSHPELPTPIKGIVGEQVSLGLPENGRLSIRVTDLEARPGAQFRIIRHSRSGTIENLQTELRISEKGRQSGVIEVSLRSTNPAQLTNILNAIGRQYVNQNVERRSEEAQKTLNFLNVQLPQFKLQLDQAEDAYNIYRNKQGTVALDEEAKLILAQAVELETKLVEAQQRRRDLTSKFTAEHPNVQTLDSQIAAWNNEIQRLNARVKRLPAVQQDAVRLERDVKVSASLYQELRSHAIQLQLVREGKIGNVRLIDTAHQPDEPVAPRRLLIAIVALGIGLLSGVLLAVIRSRFTRGVKSAGEIESGTGLTVYSTIPLSEGELTMQRHANARAAGMHVLAHVLPSDPAVESLRSLRTAIQFAMLDAPNNRIVVTGATPGVGKSFVSVNFSSILASGGKRVLLIDADLRRGHLNQYFGIARDNGLTELIAGTQNVDACIRREILPKLDFIPTGVLPPNPADLVTSRSFAELIQKLSEGYDLVLMDTAPVLVAADTLSIATLAGSRLLVARSGQTQLGELNETAKRLRQVGADATGVLFNGLDVSRRHYGSYGYKYGAYTYARYDYGMPERSA